jgi:propanol-preferring alcohol dehydrogenase
VLIVAFSMPLRPILKKNLLIRSSQTGTKADIQEALKLCAAGKVTPVFEITKLDSLNEALDRVKAGKVDGKLVLDMRDGEATW